MLRSERAPQETPSLPEGIRVGTVMRIGVWSRQAGEFYVNLLCGRVPRGAKAGCIQSKSLLDSQPVSSTHTGARAPGASEERGTGIPFQRGQPFDVLLIATDEGFKVGPCLPQAAPPPRDPGPARREAGAAAGGGGSAASRRAHPHWWQRQAWQGHGAGGASPVPSAGSPSGGRAAGRGADEPEGPAGAWSHGRGPQRGPSTRSRWVGDQSEYQPTIAKPIHAGRVRLLEVGGDLQLESVSVF
ncbi:uncharacterized protein LOC100686721 isoform X4 [Canis lupus familiaris]|uniref:uncharacterized protein LOC100686721 isoform X4 n=1 Tax=Canis lupus familiaris TaxID=9615 RepID=UPI0018F50403|nr:uncharacterized protein LOC100686721 isoform X4 [Canis lupus familiaris]